MIDAWRELGVPLDQSSTAQEALQRGLLTGWNVRKVPLYAALPEDAHGVSRTVEVHERVGVVRDSPHIPGQVDHVGIVSPSYHIIPNEDQTDLLGVMAEESGASFYAAGEMEAGRKAFVALRLPGHISIGESTVDCLVTTVKSHDGTMPFTLLVTPAHNGVVLTSHRITVRHSAGAGAALTRLTREWLEETFVYLEHFHVAAKQLVDTPMSFAKFEALVDRKFGKGRIGAVMEDGSDSLTCRPDRRIAEMTELFDGGRTAWDGFVALATWYDTHFPVRGDTVRAQKALLDSGFKDRALDIMNTN